MAAFLKKHLRSYVFALRGLQKCFSRPSNLWVEALIGVLVIFLGLFYQISGAEWLAVILAIGLVVSTEIMNTAIEAVLDFLHKEHHEDIGKAKDIAAAAVLLAALASGTVGLVIFIPKLLNP